MILALTSLSESDAKWWLGASEIFLIVSAIVLMAGIVEGWRESWSWRKRKVYKIAKRAIVLGIVAELVGDAGIFETSSRLQAHADTKTDALRAANLALEAQIAPRSLSPAAGRDIGGQRRCGSPAPRPRAIAEHEAVWRGGSGSSFVVGISAGHPTGERRADRAAWTEPLAQVPRLRALS